MNYTIGFSLFFFLSNSFNNKNDLREIKVRLLRWILLANKEEIVTLVTKQWQDRRERITELAGLNSFEVAKAWSQTGAALEYRSPGYGILHLYFYFQS